LGWGERRENNLIKTTTYSISITSKRISDVFSEFSQKIQNLRRRLLSYGKYL